MHGLAPVTKRTNRFHELHERGCFVIPNPWDRGSAILLEHNGRTTKQSLSAVAAMMHERQMSRAIFVSDPFHMLRLSILSRGYDVTPFTSPTQTSPISANRGEALGYMLSESVKVPLTLLVTPFTR